MRRLVLLLAMAMGAMLLPLSAADTTAADTTKIEIVVTNETGRPVDNASVIVKFISGRSKAKFGRQIRTEWEMKTSQEGVAKIPGIPKGNVLIQVIARNYQTFGQTFDIEQDEKTVTIKLNPPQPQYSAH